MSERLTTPDDQGPDAAAPALAAAAPMMQRVILGLLIVVFGGILLSRSLLGLLVLVAGAWLATGKGLRELGRGLRENSTLVLRGVLSLLFFCGAMSQAWYALLPTLPLLALSAALLPSTRKPAAWFLPMPPAVREVVVVALLVAYGRLVASNWSDQIEATRQIVLREIAQSQRAWRVQ